MKTLKALAFVFTFLMMMSATDEVYGAVRSKLFVVNDVKNAHYNTAGILKPTDAQITTFLEAQQDRDIYSLKSDNTKFILLSLPKGATVSKDGLSILVGAVQSTDKFYILYDTGSTASNTFANFNYRPYTATSSIDFLKITPSGLPPIPEPIFEAKQMTADAFFEWAATDSRFGTALGSNYTQAYKDKYNNEFNALGLKPYILYSNYWNSTGTTLNKSVKVYWSDESIIFNGVYGFNSAQYAKEYPLVSSSKTVKYWTASMGTTAPTDVALPNISYGCCSTMVGSNTSTAPAQTHLEEWGVYTFDTTVNPPPVEEEEEDNSESNSTWFGWLWDRLSSLLNVIVSSITDLGSSLGGLLNNIWNGITDVWDAINLGFDAMGQKLGRLLEFFTPSHDDFILKIAFVPDTNYGWEKYYYLFRSQFAFFFDISDKFRAFNDPADNCSNCPYYYKQPPQIEFEFLGSTHELIPYEFLNKEIDVILLPKNTVIGMAHIFMKIALWLGFIGFIITFYRPKLQQG